MSFYPVIIYRFRVSIFRTVLLLALLTVAIPRVCSMPVTAMQARSTVQTWLALDSKPLGTSLSRQIAAVQAYTVDNDFTAYYVVSLAPEGFVIVAADDLIEPIIAFSPGGVYDPTSDNPLKELVDSDLQGRLNMVKSPVVSALDSTLAESISTARSKWQWLSGGTIHAMIRSTGRISYISDERVSPLTQTRWSQGTMNNLPCYNYYTPPYTTGSANNYLCGCVATAMAQVMFYFNHPTTSVGTASFPVKVDGAIQSRSIRGGDGLGGPYDFDNMVLVPDSNTNLVERQAIGALCHDAGVAAHTNFTSNGSSASLNYAVSALTDVFGYSNAVLGSSYGNLGTELIGMINPNLDAGYPVILATFNSVSGHALICDGYGYNASSLYHHLNMGWSGLDNAWYNLPTIEARDTTYTSVEQCIYNIYTTGTGEIISGRVTDEQGNPLMGATVSAARNGVTTNYAITNNNGIYALTKLQSNSSYTITISKPGYSSASQTTSVS